MRLRLNLVYVVSCAVAIVVAAVLWSPLPWWAAILIGLAAGFLVFVVGAFWVSRREPDIQENEYGLAPLRTRGITRVRIHADLVMLARLGQALTRARTLAIAA